MVDLSATVTPPAGANWTSTPATFKDSARRNRRSPFEPVGNMALDDWEEIRFFAVGPVSGQRTEGRLAFDTDQKGLRFLWGSPDNDNRVSFYHDGMRLETVMRSDGAGMPRGRGAALVEVTDIAGGWFDEVRFERGGTTFEFASISATPVPLPAAGWMLLGGLAALGAMGRRRGTA